MSLAVECLDLNQRLKEKNIKLQVKNSALLSEYFLKYAKQFESGKRSFSISSMGYPKSQKKMLFALSDFISNSFEVKRSLILVNGLMDDIVDLFVANSIQSSIEVTDIKSIKAYVLSEKYWIVDYNQILDFAWNFDEATQTKIIKNIKSDFESTFFDVPQLEEIEVRGSKINFLLNEIDSLGIIVPRELKDSNDLNYLKKYYSKFDIEIV